MATNYYYGQGCVYIAPVTDGVISGGFTAVGDADLLEITPSQEFLDITESKSGKFKRVKHIETSSNFSFSLNVKEISAENLKKAFYGTLTANTAATSFTDTVTAYDDSMVPLTHINISNVSVEVSGGTGALVLGTDYSIGEQGLANGHIVILPGHTHADLSSGSSWTLEVTYDYASSDKVEFGKEVLKHFAIIFEGINVAENGRAERVTIHNVSLNMSTTLNLITDDAGTLSLVGEALPDAADNIITYVQTA